MSIPIQNIKNLTDPLQIRNFRMQIQPLPTGLAGVSSDELSIRCIATTLPGRSIEQSIVPTSSGDIRYPGRPIYSGSWNVTIVESNQANVNKLMRNWMELASSALTGLAAPSIVVKATAVLELLNGQNEVVLKRRIMGLWPQDLPDQGLDVATSDALRVEAVFSYDYWQDII